MKILISGGGTAGHINPGIAIAKEIKKVNPETQILFIGTQNGLEKNLVPKEGFELKLIEVKGFRRKLSLDTLSSCQKLIKGIFQARKIIKQYKPDIVIGTGGYVCGPVLFDASMMKIPTIIHEQNVYPGVTNKILSKFVDVVAVSFEDTLKYINSKNIQVVGNPIRQEIINSNREESRKKLGLNNEKLIVAFGGSIGAQKINNTIIDYIKKGIPKNIKIIFGTGAKQFDEVNQVLKSSKVDLSNVLVLPYIENMDVVMSGADLIICRAGAITVSEITAIGVPAILIPSPNVTHNHQEYNARALENGGAAKVLLEKELEDINFKEYVESILNDEVQLKKMKQNSKKMGRTDATQKIYNIIDDLFKNKGRI